MQNADWTAYCVELVERLRTDGGPTLVSVMGGLDTRDAGRTRAVLARHRALDGMCQAITVVLSPQAKFDRELRAARELGLVMEGAKFVPAVPLIFATHEVNVARGGLLRRLTKHRPATGGPTAWTPVDEVELPPELQMISYEDARVRAVDCEWRHVDWLQVRRGDSTSDRIDYFLCRRTGRRIIIDLREGDGYLSVSARCVVLSGDGACDMAGSYSSVVSSALNAAFRSSGPVFVSDVIDTDNLVVAAAKGAGPAVRQLHGRSLRRLGQAGFSVDVFPTMEQLNDAQGRSSSRSLRCVPHYLELPSVPFGDQVDKKGLVYVGRLDANKRISDAISAVGNLISRDGGVTFEIFGKGPDEARLREQAERLSIGDSVAFKGFTQEPFRALKRARVSIHTSRNEGFGLALHESLLAGAPVVCYRFKYGPNDIVKDGVNGYLVDDGDVEGLTSAIDTVLRMDEADYQDMSENALRSAAGFTQSEFRRNWTDIIFSDLGFPNTAS